MANHLSSKQRIRRNARRAEFNAARKSRVHTFTKKFEAALAGGDKAFAQKYRRPQSFPLVRPRQGFGLTRL